MRIRFGGRGRRKAEIDGLWEFLRACQKAPKRIRDGIKQAAWDVGSDLIVPDSNRRARRANRQLAATIPSFRMKRDRVPVIQAGSSARATSSGAKIHEILFGSEFGSDNMPQFPKRVRDGRSIYPSIYDNADDLGNAYLDAIEEVFLA